MSGKSHPATVNPASAMKPSALPETTSTAVSEWRKGWALVIGGAVAMIVTSITTNVLGLFVKPLEAEFGWSRAQITSGLLMPATVVLLLSPVTGKIINRFGPRRVLLIGIFALSVAIACLGLTGPALWTWFLAWAVVGAAQAFAGPIVCSAAVVRRFSRSRGLALAVMLSGSGLATMIAVPAAAIAIDALGWRLAYLALGATACVVGWPLVYLFFRDANATGAVQHGKTATGHSDGRANLAVFGASRLWRLALGCFSGAIALSTLLVHLAPILTDRGIPTSEAVTIVAVMGPSAIIGRFLGGYLLDRIFAPVVGAVMFLLLAASCLLLLASVSVLGATIAGALAGLSLGLEVDLIAYLVSRYYGMRLFATVYGFLIGLYGIGFGVGAVIAGAVYDHLGSYDAMLKTLVIVLILGTMLIATLGRYPSEEELDQF